VFAGWVIDKKMMQAELGQGFFRIWRPVIRWVVPIAIGVVLVMGVWEKLRGS